MISNAVLNRADEFRHKWNKQLAGYPRHALDFTWPSVGTVDRLLHRLSKLQDFDTADRQLLFGAAAYLGVMTHECWSSFTEEKSITVDENTANDGFEITITAQGGQHLQDNATFSVSLVQTLNTLLWNCPSPFPIFPKSSRVLTRGHNILSVFGVGLLTGLCPFGKGPWQQIPIDAFKEPLQACNQHLAVGTAQYYASLYSDEQHGATASLYEQNLILPPAHFGEPLPACRAVMSLIAYLREHEVPEAEASTIALNLAATPDELLSSTGFAIAAALAEQPPAKRLTMIGQSLGAYATQLRGAMITALIHLEKGQDIATLLEKKQLAKASTRLAIERKLGMLPLFRLSSPRLEDVSLHRLIRALCWSNAEKAREIIEELDRKKTLHPEVLLQAIYLDIVLGDTDSAEKGLATFSSTHDVNTLKHRASYFELCGLLAALKQNPEDAKHNFEEAFRSPPTETTPQQVVGTLLSNSLAALGEFEPALDMIEQTIGNDPSDIRALLSRVRILRNLNREEEANLRLQSLAADASTDRRVFELITS